MPDKDLPETEELPPLPPPVVNNALLAIMVVLFICMAAANRWHTYGFPEQIADLFGDKTNARILEGGRISQWWRLITPIFLHGGLLHLAVNAISLYVMGRQLEPFYGSRKYLIIFMVSGIAGVAASCRFAPQTPSLGASGALFGLVGAGIVFPMRYRHLVQPEQGRKIVIQLTLVAAANLALGFTLRKYIDNAAHIGGLLGGACTALVLIPDALMDARSGRATNAALWIASSALFVLTAVAGACQAAWALGPWWTITIPKTYHVVGKTGQFEGRWSSSDNVDIEITDTQHNVNTRGLALYLLQTSAGAPYGRFAGRPARVMLLRAKSDMVEFYLISVYGRMLVMTFHGSVGDFARHKQEFDRIAGSLRFLHEPPPDLHPVPLRIPVNAPGGAGAPNSTQPQLP